MKASYILALIGVVALLAAPGFVPIYLVHLLIQILLLGFIYTAWSMMGRFHAASRCPCCWQSSLAIPAFG